MKWYVKLILLVVIVLFGVGTYHFYQNTVKSGVIRESISISQRFGHLFTTPPQTPVPSYTLAPTPTDTPQRSSIPAYSMPPEGTFYIDINTATEDALMTLPGVDQALARQIIKNRQDYGLFTRKEALLRVQGMTDELLDSIWDYIIVLMVN